MLPPDLTPLEQEAFLAFREAKRVPYTLTKALKLYEFFLNGYSYQNIVDTDPQKLELGAVVDSSIRYRWVERREEALNALFDGVKIRVIKASAEAIDYTSTIIQATNKKHGNLLKKYLETGDEALIASMDLTSFKQFKEAAELLKTLTQDTSKRVTEVNHTHTIKPPSPKVKVLEPSYTALDMLKVLSPQKAPEE